MASLEETRVKIDNVNNSQNSCLIMQMFQIMQKNQAAPAIPENNTGALSQMMMLQIVQKIAASMDLFPPVMAPSILLHTHEPTIYATRQRADFRMKVSHPCLRFLVDFKRIDDEDMIVIPVCVVYVRIDRGRRTWGRTFFLLHIRSADPLKFKQDRSKS